MLIIAGNSHPTLARSVATLLDVPIVIANSQKFADQELRIHLQGHLCHQNIILIQSTSAPANDHLMELLLLADTARRAGAKTIVAVIPYFGYGRQDRPSYAHGPISASLIARLLEAATITHVITIDMHSPQSEGFFRINVHNLNPLPLFAPFFRQLPRCVVVSPDVGGLARARFFSDLLGAELAFINKNRNQGGECTMHQLIGEVEGKNCLLVDDILDTGGTLHGAAQLLQVRGAASISACITHGVFSAQCLDKIRESGFCRILCTDTVPQAPLPAPMEKLSVADLLADAVRPWL